MKRKIVEGDDKLGTNGKKEQVTKNEDILEITKKTKNKFKSLLKSHSNGKYFAFIPFIIIILIFILQLIYFKFNIHEIINGDLPDMIIPSILLTIILFLIFLYDEYKYKRLYKQVCNKTIIIKQVEIIKFKRYRPRGNFNDSKNKFGEFGYRVVASDGRKKYKSKKFMDEELGLDERHNTGYTRLDFILEFIKAHKKKDHLTIGKTYYIGDKVTVFIDSDWNNNYYVDI